MTRLRGKVIKGEGRGKDLGFPTANISIRKKITEGIYLSKITANGKIYNGLTFIGKAITFGATKTFAESYLLDFSEDLYGKEIIIQLLQKMRDNKKFSSPEDLIQQMNEDVAIARKFFTPWC